MRSATRCCLLLFLILLLLYFAFRLNSLVTFSLLLLNALLIFITWRAALLSQAVHHTHMHICTYMHTYDFLKVLCNCLSALLALKLTVAQQQLAKRKSCNNKSSSNRSSSSGILKVEHNNNKMLSKSRQNKRKGQWPKYVLQLSKNNKNSNNKSKASSWKECSKKQAKW